MRWTFYLVTAAALICSTAWLSASPDGTRWMPASASALVVFIGAVGTLALRRRREDSSRTEDSDSVERDLALQAQAKTFIDALVVGAALSACLWLFDLAAYAGALVTLYLGVITADFWLRYAVRLNRARP